MDDRQDTRKWFVPVLGVFAGGLVYALLPAGGFGANDLAARAAITGTAAGVTALLASMVTSRSSTR